MERISEMIEEMCPEGVEWIPLENVLTYEQPGKYMVSSTQYDDTYTVPVLTAGQSFILGYTNETEGIYHASSSNPVIIFDDFTTGFHWVNFDFKIKSSAIKMLRTKNSDCSLRYLFYAMSCINYIPANHTRHWISVYSKFEIPLPPLSIQQAIVNILDKFTFLIANLETELASRQKQYEHYRDSLFSEDLETMLGRTDCDIKTIGDLGLIIRGKRFVRTDIVEDGVSCIHYGDMYTYYGLKAEFANTHITADKAKSMRFAKKGDVIIVGAGENDWDIGVGMVWLGEEPAAIHDACYILEHSQNPMYISHYFRSTVYHLQLRKYVSSGKISSFAAKDLAKIYIPIPSLHRQQEIVSILDTFEALISNIKQELEVRKKQYEYYREKLLTFE